MMFTQILAVLLSLAANQPTGSAAMQSIESAPSGTPTQLEVPITANDNFLARDTGGDWVHHVVFHEPMVLQAAPEVLELRSPVVLTEEYTRYIDTEALEGPTQYIDFHRPILIKSGFTQP